MPKATASSPFSVAAGAGDDEEDKTTIESGWEEEPSTTIAQGEVAEQIRAIGSESPRRTNTNVTSTNAGMADELTVDDQHANVGLSLNTPVMFQARLVVTGGNDAGQDVAIQPGKTYTVGRAVENDIVLTDIAVSRKHFDLRHEPGAWVLVDRGSGNGTLVNGNLEDHPFTLANGDAIEIGNTTFRFELPNGAPRARSSFEGSMDEPRGQHDDEEEEPSTVAGKPLRYDELATPSRIPAKGQAITQPPRAKTMPPPAALRSRSPSVQSPPMYPPPGPMTGPASSMSAAMTAPMPGALPPMPATQQANPRPIGAQAPTMLGDAMGIQMPGMLPSTIPGQGPPLGSQQPMYNPYSNHGQPPQNLAQMLVVNGMPPGRDATAIVPPTPYGGIPLLVPPPSYVAPTISRRTKLILGGAGLTLFAAIATVAIIKGAGGGTPKKPQPSEGSAVVKTSAKDSAIKDAPTTEPKLTATPIVTTPMTTPPRLEPKLTVMPTVSPPKTTPPKIENKLATVLKGEPPKVEPLPKVEPPPRVESPKVEPPKVAKKEPAKKEPKKREPPPKIAKKEPEPEEDPQEEPPPRNEPPPKRVAVGDTGARTRAEGLYKAKKFAEAASVMLAASKAASDEDQAKEHRLKGGFYGSFGKNFNIGMAQSTSAKEAWTALTAARTYDNSLGGDYIAEINARMGEIAPKAAVAFMAGKNYVKAKEAVAVAERSGNSNSTTAGVRSSLEQKAGDLYKEAESLKSSDPSAATQKFREIQGMVESKSPWHQKAGKALIAIKSS